MRLGPLIQAFGIGTLVSAFGYAALRAHWNFLGVAVAGGVPADRYVSETWSVVAGSFPLLLLATLVLLTLVLLSRGAVKLFPRVGGPALRALPALLLLGLLVAQLVVWRTISIAPPCHADVLLGDLARKSDCFAPRNGQFAFLLALVVIAGSFLATRAETLTHLQLAIRVFALIVAIQLPLVYGYTIKQPLYRVMRTDAVTGVLLLQTSNAIEVWDATGGRGRMRVLPAAASMESGATINLLEAACAMGDDPRPDAFQRLCNEQLSSGGR